MKIIHKESKQVIDVPDSHADMLIKQGWHYHKEVKVVEEVQEEATKKGKKNV